jgi:4-hydroxybenzoate polyprenyltransferase
VRWAIQISRPLLWLNTSMPFLWALARGRRRFRPIDVAFLAFFTFPYNYYLHAVNDLFDYETDQRNPRKGGVEGALAPRDELRRHAIASTLLMVPFVLLSAARLPWRATASLLALLGLSMAYNAPPLRLKGRPVADSLTNVLYAIPLQVGLHATGSTRVVDEPVRVFAAWGIAAHALTTITDIAEDAAAGVVTIGVRLGRRSTAAFAAAWFAVSALLAARWRRSPAAAVPLLPYLGLSAAGRTAEGESGRRLYRWFLALNVSLGAAVTLAIILPLGVAQALYVGAFATVVTLAGLLPSLGRAVLARRRGAAATGERAAGEELAGPDDAPAGGVAPAGRVAPAAPGEEPAP